MNAQADRWNGTSSTIVLTPAYVTEMEDGNGSGEAIVPAEANEPSEAPIPLDMNEPKRRVRRRKQPRA